MRKIVIAVAALVALVGVVVIFLLVHDFDSPELGQRLLDKVSAATGITMTARAFHLNLLKGLKLEGVEMKADGGGRTSRVVLDTLIFEHRLGPLFSGTVAIERVVLDHPVIEIVEPASGAAAPPSPSAPAPAPAQSPAPPAATPAGEDRTLSLELKELTIQNGKLSIVDQKQPGSRLLLDGLTVHLRDVGLNPSAASLAKITGSGDITLEKATLNALVLTSLRTAFQLANAAFTMPELAMTTEYGALSSSAKLDLNPAPFAYSLKATGSAIDLNKLVGASGGFGPGALQLDAEGEGPEAGAVQARGSVKLAAGTFPETKVSAAIDKAIGKNVLGGTAYKATEAAFALDRGVLTLSPFRLACERARLDLKGTAALAGPLDLDLALATPRDGIAIDGVGGGTLDVLSDDSGWIPIPIRVSGTLDAPTVRPDSSALLAQAKTGAKREAREAAHTAADNAKQKAGAALRKKVQKQ